MHGLSTWHAWYPAFEEQSLDSSRKWDPSSKKRQLTDTERETAQMLNLTKTFSSSYKKGERIMGKYGLSKWADRGSQQRMENHKKDLEGNPRTTKYINKWKCHWRGLTADESLELHVIRELEGETAEIIHSEERSNIRVIGSPHRKK